MKNTIRLLTLALLAAVFINCLTGCDKAGKANTNKGTDIITVWTGNSHSKSLLNSLVDNFNKTVGQEEGIRIEYIVKENTNQMVELAFVSDQAPDLFTSNEATTAKLVSDDKLLPIEELPGGAELIKKYDGILMDRVHKYNGKTYQLPYDTNTNGLIYNIYMFKAAGIVDANGEPTPPETFDELRDYARRLTNAGKKEYGIVFPVEWEGWYGSDINSAGAASCGYVDGYNPKTGKFDFSVYGDIMKTYMRIKKDGSCLPGAEGLSNDQARARFAIGGIGMKFAGSYDYGVLTDQFPAKCKWGVAPLPVVDKNDVYKQICSNSGYLSINKQSLNRISGEKLMTAYKFFHSDEVLAEAYKAGLSIPYNWDIVKDITVDASMDNWKKFASYVSISEFRIKPIASDITGHTDLVTMWRDHIWAEKVSEDEIDKILQNYSNIKNDGIQKYKDSHPEYDPSSFINPYYNAKR